MDIRKHLAARTGYELFITSQGTSLTDINTLLASRGLPEVSDRMLRHYRAMAHWGQQTYLPINEFDIAVKNSRLSKAS